MNKINSKYTIFKLAILCSFVILIESIENHNQKYFNNNYYRRPSFQIQTTYNSQPGIRPLSHPILTSLQRREPVAQNKFGASFASFSNTPQQKLTVPSNDRLFIDNLFAGAKRNLKQGIASDSLASFTPTRPPVCPFKTKITCDPNSRYRSIDGTCNNLKVQWWGQFGTPYKRLMDPDYSDKFKINEPRVSLDGSELPNPRKLACALHGEFYDIESSFTHMLMQFGQFLSHETSNLVVNKAGEKTTCTTCTRDEKCAPIKITENFGMHCMNSMKHDCFEIPRSYPSFGNTDCSSGRREQINLQTSYIDGSAIYGKSSDDLEKLRDRTNGKGLLKVQSRSGNKDLLPTDLTQKPSDCLDFSETTRCFKAGDERVNQNPPLMTLHTLFVREHNRIANILSSMNSIFDDETVFQETRRIIVAMFQHIVYNEYLPSILSPAAINLFKLSSAKGFDLLDIYDPNIDPRLSNEFIASIGRFGHSMIRSTFSRANSNYEQSGTTSFLLRNHYFRSIGLYDEFEGGVESIVRGLLKDPVMKVDRWFAADVTQHLFQTTDNLGFPKFKDLTSINIYRGRDHGIPSYVKFREFCELEPVKTWNDMKKFVENDVVDILSQHYKFVEDVDIFVVMNSEFKEKDSLVGPVINCVMGSQFHDLKFGDRFWYETDDPLIRFLPEQINEIRKITLSKLLCRTLADTPLIQKQAFRTVQPDNPLVKCDDLPDIDWTKWKSQN